jgi:SAM-dependent methyltransferase
VSGKLAQSRTGDLPLRSGPQRREYEAIADRIAASSPGSTLDWGCGWGLMTRLMRDRGVDVTAYEYREDVEPGVHALEKFPEIAAHFSDDPVTLPFADDSFSTVLSCGVLEHVVDPDRSLDEIRRVLSPGGRLYVYKLPNRFSYLESIAKRLGWYYHGALPNDRLYTVRTAVDLLERHGYSVSGARYANMLPLTLPGPFATRHADRIWWANSLLARVPGLNRLATNVELLGRAG